MRIVVSIDDPPVWTIPPAEVARIASALPDDEVIDARDALSRRREFAAADVLFATRITDEEFGLARRVRWIHSSAVGVGGLLPPSVVASDVIVSNSRGIHSDAIGEHAIALVLALRRRLHLAVARQIERRWAQEELSAAVVPALADTRLLVIGLGSIGARVAALGAALGMQVRGIRRRPELGAPPGVRDVFSPNRLADLLPSSDVVVLATPRTEHTRALMGAEEFALLPAGAILVNVARGRLTDEAALAAALASGRLGAAGLDAFQEEPLPAASPLWALPNVLITPHTAAFSGEYWRPVSDVFMENLARFKRGQPLANLVDKVMGY